MSNYDVGEKIIFRYKGGALIGKVVHIVDTKYSIDTGDDLYGIIDIDYSDIKFTYNQVVFR